MRSVRWTGLDRLQPTHSPYAPGAHSCCPVPLPPTQLPADGHSYTTVLVVSNRNQFGLSIRPTTVLPALSHFEACVGKKSGDKTTACRVLQTE